MLIIIVPFPKVFLPEISPIHGPLAFFHVILPIALEVISRRVVVHLPLSMLQVVFEIALENASTLEDDFSFPFLLTLFPLALVGRIINFINPVAMSKPIFDFAFVNTSIRPLVDTLTRNPIISKLPFIDDPIGPGELPRAVEQTIIKVPFVSIAIFECNRALTIQAFPIDL